MQNDTILGISLGTRRLGMAIGNHNELMEWQIKVFDETYSRKKVKRIWRAIERTIERYDINVIGLKICPKSLRSEGLNQCLEYITEKALNQNIVLFYFDIQTIEGYFLKGVVNNKYTLAESIADKYPELKREFFKLSKSQYTMRIFEAVGAMDLALFELLKDEYFQFNSVKHVI